MRVEAETFKDSSVARIYLAANIREAKRVEKLLTDHDVEYVVELEPFMPRGLFAFREHMGAAFYVVTDQARSCRIQLEAAGLKRGLEPEEEAGLRAPEQSDPGP